MTVPEQNQSLWANLEQLRIDSLTIMAYFCLAVGSLWLILLIYPVTGTLRAAEPWIGSVLLIAIALVSFVLKDHHAHWARHIFSWGILAVTVLAIAAYRPSEITALLVLPIILASVLLGRRSVFLIAAASTVLTLVMKSRLAASPLSTIEALFPICVIALVALASWLSVSNLY